MTKDELKIIKSKYPRTPIFCSKCNVDNDYDKIEYKGKVYCIECFGKKSFKAGQENPLEKDSAKDEDMSEFNKFLKNKPKYPQKYNPYGLNKDAPDGICRDKKCCSHSHKDLQVAVEKAVATEKKRFEKIIDEIFDEFVFERDECLVDKKGDEMWIELKKLIKNKLGEHNEK